jgi:hypothetical protein
MIRHRRAQMPPPDRGTAGRSITRQTRCTLKESVKSLCWAEAL